MIVETNHIHLDADVTQYKPAFGGDGGQPEIDNSAELVLPENRGLRRLWLSTSGDREVLLPEGTPPGFRVVIPQTYHAEGYEGDNPWGDNAISPTDESRLNSEQKLLQDTILAGVRRGMDSVPSDLHGLVKGDDEVDVVVMKPKDFPYYTSISTGIADDGSVKIQLVLGDRQSDATAMDNTIGQRAKRATMTGILMLFEQRNPDLLDEWLQRGGSKPNELHNSLSGALQDVLEGRVPMARISNADGTTYEIVPLTKGQTDLLERLFDNSGRNFDSINGTKILWTKDSSSSSGSRWIAVH